MKKSKLILIIALNLLLFSTTVQSQNVVRGTVMDEKGETLPGVNVKIKDSKTGTVTDFNGKFSLKTEKQGDVLVVSYLGYETKEINADKSKPMQIELKEEVRALNEIMVVGYQDIKKKDLTGSVAKANLDDMLKAPVASFDQALAGRIAGVSVSSSEGTPGGTMNIVIRGNNSLTQENSPLYVIDGFPVEDPAAANSINPNDIESVDILKDASATAIYGARGANGVVIISTKKGKIGAPVLSYNGDFGVQRVTRKIPMMNAYEFVKLQEEMFSTTDMAGPYGYYQTYNGKTYSLEDYKNVEQYDWQDLIFQDAMQQSHNVGLTGGTSDIRYNGSISYFDQDGVVISSNFNRLQGRFSTQVQHWKFKFNITANYSKSVYSGNSPSQSSYSGMNNLFYSVWGYRPVTTPNYDINTLIENNTDDGIDPAVDYRFNPIMSLKNEYNVKTNTYSGYNGFFEYDIMKGLKLKVSGGYTSDNRVGEIFWNSKTRGGMPTSTQKTNASYSNSDRITWLNENILTYQTNIKKKHFFNSMIGLTIQDSKLKTYSMQSILIPNESLGMAGMGQGTPSTMSSVFADWSMLSYLGRINYNYKSKYYLTASFRADGSSKFAKENRFGYFPSLSAAWTFTQEKFMSASKEILNNGKMRLSWGSTGNNRVSEYDTYARILMQQSAYGTGTGLYDVFHGVYPVNNSLSNIGAILSGLPNKELKWETTSQTNIGIDLALLNDRINFTFDWYNKITSDLLLRASLPLSTGFASAMKNIGKVQNQGLEFTLNTVNVKTKNFKWTTNFNIAFNRNKVLELSENQTALLTNAAFDQNYISPNYIAKIGYPIGMMYGYMYEGTYKLEDFNISNGSYTLKSGIPRYISETNTKPGYPRYADLNEDGVIDTKDQTFIGRGEPIHAGGITNNFDYAGFDLSVFFQWSYGADILNANRLLFESGFNRRANLNQFASYVDRWTFENPESDIPRVSSSPSNTVFSTRVIEDGSYLRLKTVSLGYTLQKKILERYKIEKVRVFVSAQNLYTLTNFSGYDPEVSVRNSAITPGLDFSAYPRAFTMNMGVNVVF